MVIKKIKDTAISLISDGHITALSAVCISVLPLYLFDFSVPKAVHLIPFLGAEIIYSFNRYKEKKEDGYDKKVETFLRKKEVFFYFFIFSGIFFIGYLLWFRNFILLAFGLFLTATGLLYSLFLKKITKKIRGFKNFLVSFCWALIVLLPFIFKGNLPEEIFSALLMFIFIFMNVLIFEIFLDFGDLEQDKRMNLLTLPSTMSKKQLLSLLLTLNFLSLFPVFLGLYLNYLPSISAVFFFSFFYNFSFLYIIIKEIELSAWFSNLLVDLSKIIWFLLFLLVHNFL